MWYSYSGDHISAELGFEYAYHHLLLGDSYFEFYKEHPRNTEDIKNGRLTWLELGLHNFATHNEYILNLTEYFGNIDYLQWVICKEAFDYKHMYSKQWNQLLSSSNNIKELDLVLGYAGIVLTKKQMNK